MKREKIPGSGIGIADPIDLMLFAGYRKCGLLDTSDPIDVRGLMMNKMKALTLNGRGRYPRMIVRKGCRILMRVIST